MNIIFDVIQRDKTIGYKIPKMLFVELGKISHLLGLLLSLTALPISIISVSVSSANAEEASPISISGFGTLGLARSSSKDVEFIRDLSQPKGIKSGEWSGLIDTVLGVQANWQILPELEVVGQLVSRYHYDDNRDPRLDWAFIKWVPDSRLSLRLGRIGSDIMMRADARVVGYSSLTVRPSVDFFGTLIFSSLDGADVSLTLPIGEGLIRSKLFSGVVEEKVSGSFGTWDTTGSHVYGGIVDYFIGPWQLRFSAAAARYSNNIDTPQANQLTDGLYAAADATGIDDARIAADGLATKGAHSYYHSLGAIYDKGPLQIQAAVNNITTDMDSFQNSQSGYLLAGYRIKEVTPYVGISRWVSTPKDVVTGLPDTLATPGGTIDFSELNQGYQATLDATGANQTTYTLGARWDVFPNIALKFQWDAIRGNEDSKTPYAGAQTGSGWAGRTDVISTTLDFTF
jgi:hypothetical protein